MCTGFLQPRRMFLNSVDKNKILLLVSSKFMSSEWYDLLTYAQNIYKIYFPSSSRMIWGTFEQGNIVEMAYIVHSIYIDKHALWRKLFAMYCGVFFSIAMNIISHYCWLWYSWYIEARSLLGCLLFVLFIFSPTWSISIYAYHSDSFDSQLRIQYY